MGTTARELTTEELWQAYPHRWPVETLFYIGAETIATSIPWAWTEHRVRVVEWVVVESGRGDGWGG